MAKKETDPADIATWIDRIISDDPDVLASTLTSRAWQRYAEGSLRQFTSTGYRALTQSQIDVLFQGFEGIYDLAPSMGISVEVRHMAWGTQVQGRATERMVIAGRSIPRGGFVPRSFLMEVLNRALGLSEEE